MQPQQHCHCQSGEYNILIHSCFLCTFCCISVSPRKIAFWETGGALHWPRPRPLRERPWQRTKVTVRCHLATPGSRAPLPNKKEGTRVSDHTCYQGWERPLVEATGSPPPRRRRSGWGSGCFTFFYLFVFLLSLIRHFSFAGPSDILWYIYWVYRNTKESIKRR